ncbi:MAG: hypothetical protein CPDRYMAC_7000, partial [uncultured Paraburkholderia sp.]
TYLRTQWPKLIRFTTTPHALRYLTLGNVVRGSHTVESGAIMIALLGWRVIAWLRDRRTKAKLLARR